MKKIIASVIMMLMILQLVCIPVFGENPAHYELSQYGQQTTIVGDSTGSTPVMDGTINFSSGEYAKEVILNAPGYWCNSNTVYMAAPSDLTKAPQQMKLYFNYDNDNFYIAIYEDLWYVNSSTHSPRSNYQLKIGCNMADMSQFLQWGVRGFDSNITTASHAKPSNGTYHASGTAVPAAYEPVVDSKVVLNGNATTGYEQIIEIKLSKEKLLTAFNQYCGTNYDVLPNTIFFSLRDQSYGNPVSNTSLVTYSVWNANYITDAQKAAIGTTINAVPNLVVFGDTICAPDYTSVDLPNKPADSTLRIVSNNILLQSINSNSSRRTNLERAFELLDADVYALQEVDDTWHTTAGLDSTMDALGYSLVPINATGDYAHLTDALNRNPIYYKESTVRLIDSGYDRYDSCDFENITYNGEAFEYLSYGYTWALLEEIATNKRFVVISTHFIASMVHDQATDDMKTSTYSNQCRIQNAEELSLAMSSFESTYNVPVIAVGDFNSNYNSTPYSVMREDFYSARNNCTSTENMEYKTTNTLGSAPTTGTGAIDHCFYSKDGVSAKHFETVVSAYTYCYSDHVPTCFDFALE